MECTMHQCGQAIVCMHYCGMYYASVWISHRLYALLWNVLCISVDKPSSVCIIVECTMHQRGHPIVCMHYCGMYYASVWTPHRLYALLWNVLCISVDTPSSVCIIVECTMHQCGHPIVCMHYCGMYYASVWISHRLYALLWNVLCISVDKPSSVMHCCEIIYAPVWISHRLLCIIVKLSMGELQTVAIICINTVLFITCMCVCVYVYNVYV